jgi:adenylate cyclase
MPARITIIGPEGRQEVELKPHNTLGRHPNNTIQLLDRIVSKEHLHISQLHGAWVAKDLGSLNGTCVNGERITGERTLNNADEITLGSTRILFQSDTTAVPSGHSGDAGTKSMSRVTMTPGMVESHIRTKLAPLQDISFMPERLVTDLEALRRDYEKLRVSYELQRAIGVELDVDKLLAKILDTAFQLLAADRGVVLLVEDDGSLRPRCVRTKRAGAATSEEVVLSTTIIESVRRDKAAVLSSDASMDSRFSGAHSIIMQGIRSTMAVPLLQAGELFGIMILDSQIATNAFTEKDLQLFQNVANQAAIAIQNGLFAKKLEKEAVTRERFQRLLSPAIADQVLSGRVEIAKGGELRDTTVLFTDIRGFTSMSESARPQDIVNMLNEYFEQMVEIVFKYEGTLDKFVGDEIMALYGSPVAHADDAYRAVKTALEMLRVLAEWNRKRASEGEIPIQIGVGINCGEVVAGYLGSSRALEYTVIGDVVNTGARLCSVAKAGEIVVSEAVYLRVRDHFEAVELPAAQVKGKSAALKIYRVVGERHPHAYADDLTRPS